MSAVPIDDKQDQQQQPQQQQDGVPHLVDVPTPKYVTKVFHFEQKVPIPSYLLALAVGELECRELSPRSKVWSEPAMVEAGAYEFAETAKFLEAGEHRGSSLFSSAPFLYATAATWLCLGTQTMLLVRRSIGS